MKMEAKRFFFKFFNFDFTPDDSGACSSGAPDLISLVEVHVILYFEIVIWI